MPSLLYPISNTMKLVILNDSSFFVIKDNMILKDTKMNSCKDICDDFKLHLKNTNNDSDMLHNATYAIQKLRENKGYTSCEIANVLAKEKGLPVEALPSLGGQHFQLSGFPGYYW